MTTKERLHQHVDRMDEARADALVLEHGDGALDRHHDESEREDIDEVTRRDRERIANARLIEDNHPIWNIVGIASSAEPTDMANNKDEYIADAIEHGWQR